MNKKLLGFFSFALTVAVLVIALKFVNWLPMVIQKEALRKYGNIESVKSRLNIRDIYIPSYFPQNFRWPPTEIFAQKKPFAMIIMHFRCSDSKEIGLAIRQVDARSNYSPPDSNLKIKKLIKESRVLIKDRDAVLHTALCENNLSCNELLWKEGDFLLTIVTTASQRDLIRMAISIVPDN